MEPYQPLPCQDSSFDFEYISRALKLFDNKIKEFNNTNPEIEQEIEKVHADLLDIFLIPRVHQNDKVKLGVLEAQFKELTRTFLRKKEMKGKDSSILSSNEAFSKYVEKSNVVAPRNITEIRINEALEKKEAIDRIYVDAVALNEMVKDTSKMVNEQNFMLNQVDNNVYIAVNQNEKAANELINAEKYSISYRRKKMVIIIIILLAIAALVLAGLNYFKIISIF